MLRSFLVIILLGWTAAAHAQHTVVIRHTYYTNLYDTALCSEVQGFYLQTAEHTAICNDKTKKLKRKGPLASFRKDPMTPKSCRLKYPTLYSTYNQQFVQTDKQHTIDKGHVNPFEAFAFDSTAAEESNYYSNVCPQISHFNEQQWKQLEAYVLSKVSPAYGDVKVWTGVLISRSHPKKAGDLFVPDFYWKVIAYKKDGDSIKEAWLGPNDPSNTGNKPDPIVTTVDHLKDVIRTYYAEFVFEF